jgi:replicative DNA helicase
MSIEVGAAAPDFTLPDQDREPVSLSRRLQQGPVLLAFFPGAFSGTCTSEACTLQDALSEFTTAMADALVAAAERTLPHNLDAERSVLGAILVHNEAFNLAAQVIDSGDFFRDAHRRIFEKMVALNERGQAIDFITLKEELSRAGSSTWPAARHTSHRSSDGVPRATNVEYYARIVKEKATLRNLIFAATKILTNAYEADQEPDLILDEAESAIFAVADDRLKAGFVPMRDLVKESFPKIEQLFEQKRLITGVPTGFVDLDEMTRGPPGRRSHHRCGAAVDGKDEPRAQHVAARGLLPGQTVGFFSLEMSKESLFLRLLTSEAQIDSHRLMSGAIGQKDYGRISHALETLSAMQLHIDDTANIGVLEMRAKTRRLQAEHGLSLLVVDYIQLMSGRGGSRTGRSSCIHLAIAQGACEGAERARSSSCRSSVGRRSRDPITARSSRTCANPARSNRMPTSSCSSTATMSTTGIRTTPMPALRS